METLFLMEPSRLVFKYNSKPTLVPIFLIWEPIQIQLAKFSPTTQISPEWANECP